MSKFREVAKGHWVGTEDPMTTKPQPEPYAELAILGWKVRGDQETLQEFLAEYLGPRMEEAARQIADEAQRLWDREDQGGPIPRKLVLAILRSTMGSK